MENLFTPDCIRTFSGKYVNVFDPKDEMFCIEDIAHSLSNQCRFGGHLPEFYSVAQHSVICSQLASEKNKLNALMHDSSEAYLLDIPRPIKGKILNYYEIEDNLMTCLAKLFSFTHPMPNEVREIDDLMLRNEWEALMIKNAEYPVPECWNPSYAKQNFLKTFKQLTK